MRRWCGKGWPASPDPGRYFTAMASAAIAMLTAHPNAARADPAEPTQPKYGWVEVFSGADATRDVWLLYSGVTLAPWSKDIYSDGVRLRVVSGYGQYNYIGRRDNGAEAYDPNRVATLDLPALALDLDTPEDFASLQKNLHQT